MHYTSLENMKKVYDRYIRNHAAFNKKTVKVIDIGGNNINGSYRDIFASPKYQYKAVDVAKGKGVDIVLRNPYKLPFKNNSVDIMISGQAFEHIEFFWLTFKEMTRCLRDDGICVIIAPSSGPVHQFPVDCYRFYPDAMTALSKWGSCNLIDSWREELGEWKDMVGVFSKASIKRCFENDIHYSRSEFYKDNDRHLDDTHLTSGLYPYFDVLRYLHDQVKPDLYFEIGVDKGNSLRLSQTETIAVDPFPIENLTYDERVSLYKLTSDDYFEFRAERDLKDKDIDMAFIDGMHHFENVLKDFIHIEQYANENTVVVIDDIYPMSSIQAQRNRETSIWMGDVYKIHHCLKRYRPDLSICVLNTALSGLLLVTRLDRNNTVLKEHYNRILDGYLGELDIVGDYIDRRFSTEADYVALINQFLNNKDTAAGYKTSAAPISQRFANEVLETRITDVRRSAESEEIIDEKDRTKASPDEQMRPEPPGANHNNEDDACIPENICRLNRLMRVLYFILFDRKQIKIKLKKAFKKTQS